MLRQAIALASLLLAACGDGSSTHRGLEPFEHLVLITIDTLRADRLGSYGYAAARTPHLDSLASRGARFEDAIAQAVVTAPSHASILTGLTPPAHGLSQLAGQRLAEEHETLAELLRVEGFETAAFVSSVSLRRELGLDQGFAVYDDGRLRARRRQRRAEETNAAVHAWLANREDPTRRTFLWVHYFDPHYPYDPPADLRPRRAGALPRSANAHPEWGKDPAPSRAQQELAAALYDGEVAYTDAAVGELLANLESAGLLASAVVVAMSDHGESFGEHGYYFGHWDVFEETARVPLIVARSDERFAGAVIAAPVATTDLVPTILPWLGVDVPGAVEGRDLTPLLEDPERLEDRILYTERGYPRGATIRSVRDRYWLLARHIHKGKARLRLYRRDATERDEEAAARARARLSDALSTLEGQASRTSSPELLPIEPAVADQLRSLGYLVPETQSGEPREHP